MSSKVFICYRRMDAGWAANAIYAELESQLGDGHVFMDVNSLELGRPWLEALNSALDTCEVSLILIGPQWLDCRDQHTGTRRLDIENDFVRMEIASSLERGIPVIPITLDHTTLPDASSLPLDIEELVGRQGVSISQATYRADLRNLIERRKLGATPDNSTELNVKLSLRQLLTHFLKRYDQWSFSSLRIFRWGTQQVGFEQLQEYSKEEIRSELQLMVNEKLAETRTSKKGGTLYRLL